MVSEILEELSLLLSSDTTGQATGDRCGSSVLYLWRLIWPFAGSALFPKARRCLERDFMCFYNYEYQIESTNIFYPFSLYTVCYALCKVVCIKLQLNWTSAASVQGF